MTGDVLVTMAFAAVTPLAGGLASVVALTLARLRPVWTACWLVAALSGALVGLILGNWPWLAGSAVSAAIALVIRWRRRPEEPQRGEGAA